MEESITQAFQQMFISLLVSGQQKACFRICITKPTSELTTSDKQCIAMCQDRYEEVFKNNFFRQYEEFLKSVEEQTKNHDLE
ncbi:hypothetical protein SteCoe_14222 [Stentor coeruleus]|uniref:Mitochondrial import inner membrane translocase subunit n=1 Tax=Stentor coeruleus TaxID=5963 RepID=A0A1R2C6N0_9CILI|nr:hypothetical protein SteCoe_14222 [Stentor coeruleus]